MKTYYLIPLLLAQTVFGGITVEFIKPENYRDFSERFNGGPSSSYQHDLTKHLQELAKGIDKDISLQFTDIDLAGDFNPSQFQDVRIVSDIYRPRLTFNYTVGGITKQEVLTDTAFMSRVHIGTTDSLYHEKALLSDWFRRTFAKKK